MKKTNNLKKFNRQLGTEKTFEPLPYMHEKPSSTKIALSRLAIVFTVLFWVIYVFSVLFRQLFEGPKTYQLTTHALSYIIIVSFLILSSLLYLITRQGALLRFSKHIRTSRYLIDKFFSKKRPSITVLVPSYNEEPEIVRKTLMSAALQEYPKIKIVLLVDDDASKLSDENLLKLNSTKSVVTEIQNLLTEPHKYFDNELEEFKKTNSGRSNVNNEDLLKLVKDYEYASRWLKNLAEKHNIEDHIDVFYTEQVLLKLATNFDNVAKALKDSHKEKAIISKERAIHLYTRLVWTFEAKLEIFERKKYASLSHDPNKAMNINSYIGLMGNTFKKELTDRGMVLTPVNKTDNFDLKITDSDYILTLDADSMLLQEYCLRLVYFLEQPDNQNVGVVQTPYSSYRGAPTRIERIAGATTDVQHILHQGMTYYNATFWVGANAIIRKKALNDIEETEWVGGFEIKRYVQDHTVIEDTESSIDIAMHGWKLVNYPERLSYSATPPDFGSLIVQRRRWANGGLLILPKLWIQRSMEKNIKMSKIEYLIRLNYMASIAWSNIGLVFLLAYPYDGRLLSPLIVLASLPYFIAMANDLKYNGYKTWDIFGIYGFNLILLPVNIAGVLKSLNQALTTNKIPFGRTPKIKNRTVADIQYVIAPIFILVFSMYTFYINYNRGNWGNAAFAAFNSITIIWAIVAYIGVGNLLADLWIGIINWLYVDVKETKVKEKYPNIKNEKDWEVVLYHGDLNSSRILLNTKKSN